jgi:hypothetical protein
MKINRKESDNYWNNCRNLDDFTNEFDQNLYKRDCFEFITSNHLNYNFNKHNNYYNYCNNGRKDKDFKDKEFESIQLNHQHLHALHRFRRHRKRGKSITTDS